MSHPARVVEAPAAAQLDVTQITMLRGLRNGALLPVLLRTYREQSGAQLEIIVRAASSADAEALRIAAHTLKSSSFSIGARAVGELCAQLEAAGKAADLRGASTLCAELQRRFALVCEEIGQYL